MYANRAHAKPYRAFSDYLKEKFGCKVYKVTIDAGFTCPNRDGTFGYGGCIYCNNEGFSPNVRAGTHRNEAAHTGGFVCGTPVAMAGKSEVAEKTPTPEKEDLLRAGVWTPARRTRPVREQLEEGMRRMAKRYRARKFIAYFQAYTNTYAPVDALDKLYREALMPEDIVGLAVGTRPDCVGDEIADLLGGFARDYEVWVELGLQSVHDETLKAINRGHDFAAFENTVARIRKRPDLKICAHIILGLPGETRAMMLRSADILSDMGIEGVKLHLLHVLPDTKLEEMYNAGEVDLPGFGEYVELVADYLERLAPEIIVQRLTGDAPRGMLKAPAWAADKRKIIEAIANELQRRGNIQGAARA